MFDQPLNLAPPAVLQHFDTTVNNIQLDYDHVRHTTELYASAMRIIVPASDAAWDRIAASIPPSRQQRTADPGGTSPNHPGHSDARR